MTSAVTEKGTLYVICIKEEKKMVLSHIVEKFCKKIRIKIITVERKHIQLEENQGVQRRLQLRFLLFRFHAL